MRYRDAGIDDDMLGMNADELGRNGDAFRHVGGSEAGFSQDCSGD